MPQVEKIDGTFISQKFSIQPDIKEQRWIPKLKQRASTNITEISGKTSPIREPTNVPLKVQVKKSQAQL